MMVIFTMADHEKHIFAQSLEKFKQTAIARSEGLWDADGGDMHAVAVG